MQDFPIDNNQDTNSTAVLIKYLVSHFQTGAFEKEIYKFERNDDNFHLKENLPSIKHLSRKEWVWQDTLSSELSIVIYLILDWWNLFCPSFWCRNTICTFFLLLSLLHFPNKVSFSTAFVFPTNLTRLELRKCRNMATM